MNISTLKADKLGIAASVLCLIHCIGTPFLFLATSNLTSCCEAFSFWYSALDFIFLLISFLAIYKSIKNSSIAWIKYAMWASWTFLLAVLINEKIQLLSVVESIIYFPAMMLIFFHIYNLKYCQCKTETCCRTIC